MQLRDLPPTLEIPLWEDETGAIRVSGSRVLLEVVVDEFRDGATPEQLLASYPTLNLPAVYGVIAYYLAHREEVDRYIEWVDATADEMHRQLEVEHPEMFELQRRARMLLEEKRRNQSS